MLSMALSSISMSLLFLFDKNIEWVGLTPSLGAILVLLISVLIVSPMWPLSTKEFSSIN